MEDIPDLEGHQGLTQPRDIAALNNSETFRSPVAPFYAQKPLLWLGGA